MQDFFFVLETIGVIAFAIAGALAAIDKETDLFGVLFLSLITSFGGGMLRDVLIDRTPSFFTSYFHIICGAASALSVFVFAAVFKRKYIENEKLVDGINNYFDAVGLGIFAVTGAKICIDSGFGSALVAISLGMITSVGGGIIRDLCLREIPFVFTKRIYAVASIVGASAYYLLFKFASVPEYLSLLIGVISVVGIRTLATVFHLDMPKAIIFKKENPKESESSSLEEERQLKKAEK